MKYISDNKEFWKIIELLLMDEVAAQTKILFEKKKLLSSEPETYSLDVTFKETDVKKKSNLTSNKVITLTEFTPHNNIVISNTHHCGIVIQDVKDYVKEARHQFQNNQTTKISIPIKNLVKQL